MKRNIILVLALCFLSPILRAEALAPKAPAAESDLAVPLFDTISHEGTETLFLPSPGVSSSLSLKEEESSSAGSLPWVRVLVSFLFVASLIVFAGLVLKRRAGGDNRFFRNQALSLRVLQTLSIGVKRNLVVVDFDGAEILIGVSGNQMQFLYAKPRESSQHQAPDALNEIQKVVAAAAPVREKEVSLSEQILKSVGNLKPILNGRSLTAVEAMDGGCD